MKKYVRDIMIFVFGLITMGSIGVAAYNYNANNIEYSPSDKTWKVSTVAEAINSLVNDTRTSVMNYSESEQVVGTWIDGKPLYQKTVILDNPNTGWSPVSLGVSNIDIIYKTDCYGLFSNGDLIGEHSWQSGNAVSYFTTMIYKYNNSDSPNIYISKSSSSTLSKLIITIQYTKTTDTGNSNSS